MKLKPLVADPYQFLAAGVHTMSEAACLTHVGRCGIVGCPVSQLAEALRISESTVAQCLERLQEKRLVQRYARSNRKGRAFHWCATVPGWDVLTRPPDLTLFPGAAGKVAV